MNITQEYLKRKFDYNETTGELFRKTTGRSCGAIFKKENGKKYKKIMINYKNHLFHRIVWLYVYGNFPVTIDHIDGNGLNNKLSNLRNVSLSENAKNARLHKSNKSGVCGVSFNKQRRKWCSLIYNNGVKHELGFFNDFFEAICSRKSAEIKYGYHINHGLDRPL